MLQYISAMEQDANILTNALSKCKFKLRRDKMGVVMKPAQEKIEKIDQRLRIQPLRGGNLLYIT